MEHHRLFTVLAFAGAIPFTAAALLSLGDVGIAMPSGDLYGIAASYGLAIISFLAGTHWAFQLLRANETPFDLFISSNVAVVVVWLAFLALSMAWVLAIEAIAFVALLMVDYRLLKIGVVTELYFRARAIASAIATASLLTLLINL